METNRDFEDILTLLDRHDAEYLIVGGLAFIYHAKREVSGPRHEEDLRVLRDVMRRRRGQ